MQKAFKDIVERLEELKKIEEERPDSCDEDGIQDGEDIYDDGRSQGRYEQTVRIIGIVNQVAEGYSRTAHYGCNDNGEHEKCDGCGIADKCPDYKKYLFENTSTEYVNCSSDSLIEEVCEYEGAIECEPMSGCYGYYVPNCNKEVVLSICDTFSFKFCPYCGKKIKVV